MRLLLSLWLLALCIYVPQNGRAEDYRRHAQSMSIFAKLRAETLTMARIMTYVKDLTKASNRKRCTEEFYKFYRELYDEKIWDKSAEEFKAYLLQLSYQQKLENLPTKKHLKIYLRYSIASLAQELNLIHDPFKIIAYYLASNFPARMRLDAELLAKIDLCITTYHQYCLYHEISGRFPQISQLISAVRHQGIFTATPRTLQDLQSIVDQYQGLFQHKLDLKHLSPHQQRLLDFEVNLHGYLSQKILTKRGHVFSSNADPQRTALLSLLRQATSLEENPSPAAEEQPHCPICDEALRSSKATCTSCHNDLCLSCLTNYKQINSKASCPYCRAPLGVNFSNFMVKIIPLPTLLSKAMGTNPTQALQAL